MIIYSYCILCYYIHNNNTLILYYMRGENVMKRIALFVLTVFIGFGLVGSGSSYALDAIPTSSLTTSVDIIDVLRNPNKYPNIIIEGPYNKEEIVDIISKNENITQSQVLSQIFSGNKSNISSSSNIGYLTFRERVQVTWLYEVEVRFYIECEFYGGGPEPTALLRVIRGSLDRGVSGISKNFEGELFYHLESDTRMYWELNGDFYNNGTTTFSGGGEIGLKESAKIVFNVSYSTDHYKYIRQDGYFRIW